MTQLLCIAVVIVVLYYQNRPNIIQYLHFVNLIQEMKVFEIRQQYLYSTKRLMLYYHMFMVIHR